MRGYGGGGQVRCRECGEPIGDWQEAGRDGDGLLHKACWLQLSREATARGQEVPVLKSPWTVSRGGELLILAFVLMFHVGIGVAVAGWVLVTQGHPSSGLALLVPGLLMPALGAAGIANALLTRRRIELIRNDIERRGGWKPLP